MKPFDKNNDWSREQMNQAIQESLLFQAMKDVSNQLKVISSYFPKGQIYELHFVPYVSYALTSYDKDQPDLPLSPHGIMYKKFPIIHPSDYMTIQVQTERDGLKTFYSSNALPAKEA